LNLEKVGVALTERRAIRVNEWSQTSVPSIFSIGDVTDRVMLTPVAITEGRALAETIYNDRPIPIRHDNVPSAVFSQPEMASVGLSGEEAKVLFPGDYDVYRTRFRPMKLSLPDIQEKVMMKMIVQRSTDRVLGCHMLGSGAAEIIQCLAVSVVARVTKTQLDCTLAVHPTLSEEFVLMGPDSKVSL